ncbi:hypothetical protein DICPUDRAFT_20966, partial [Dictyostelium purpureum]
SYIINKLVEFVKKEMADNDPSHDWNHVERVWKLAVSIAEQEEFEGDFELLQLAAIAHDIKDSKYLKPGEDEDTAENTIISFLTSHQYPLEKAKYISNVVKQISFKHELGVSSNYQFLPESKIVQDADRLDAIGAIGVARTFSYGAAKSNTPFYNQNTKELMKSLDESDEIKTIQISKDQYKNHNSPTIDHFYEKLFRLESMMKTKSGQKMAKKRHEFM